MGPKRKQLFGRKARLGDPAPSSPQATWCVFVFCFVTLHQGIWAVPFVIHVETKQTPPCACIHAGCGVVLGIAVRVPGRLLASIYTSETLDRPPRGARRQPRPVFPSSRLLYGVWHRDGTLSERWFQGNRVFEVGPIMEGRRRRRATSICSDGGL